MTDGVARTRIMHVVFRFDVGGLENVIVQLINKCPADMYEHIIVSLTEITSFKSRISRPGVSFIALGKKEGHAVPLYPKLYRMFRSLRPDIVHTCNLAALEVTPLAWLARIPVRIHAEHGWDARDPVGLNLRYQRLRKLYKPFVTHYIAVSQELDAYLASKIGVLSSRRSLIGNGVDTDVFQPSQGAKEQVLGCPFKPGADWLVGTVGRLQGVKNQTLLAEAFVRLVKEHPHVADRARLVIVGDGPLRSDVERIVSDAGIGHLVWMAGVRDDIAQVLRMLDCFVLPSDAEGTSCTLQEAMATGAPCVATAVGGNPALIQDGHTGLMVPPRSSGSMADALLRVFEDAELAKRLGRAARERALSEFGMNSMVQQYSDLFQSVMGKTVPSSYANPARS